MKISSLNLITCARRAWARQLFFGLFCGGLWLTATATAGAQDQQASVTVGADASGPDLAPRFLGLSYETSAVLPHDDKYYFDATNTALIALYRTLGIKSLRIGGGSLDRTNVGIPQPPDLDYLFNFAKAAGVKVIYSFRLRQEPDAAIPLAQYIYNHYADEVDCFTIGNEPDGIVGVKTYDKFLPWWQPQYEAISRAVPGVRIGGPSAAYEAPIVLPFLQQFGPGGKLAFVSTHHYYIGGAPDVEKDTAKGRERCLSDDLHKRYEKTFDHIGAVAASLGVPYRFDETSSCSHGGADGVSDTYAAALWGLDYLHWWAAKHIIGMNFHFNTRNNAQSRGYSSFVPAADGDGFDVCALSYALLAFKLGAHGQCVPVDVVATNLNFDAYAFRDHDGSLSLTLINRSHAPVDVMLQLPAESGPGSWQRMNLTAPNDDIAAKEG